MKIAIISDIHSNASALQAVLNHIKNNGDVEEYWCLGDVLGYGGQAKETVDIMMNIDKPLRIVLGNHDVYLAGMNNRNIRRTAKEILYLNSVDLSQNEEQNNWVNQTLFPKRENPIISIEEYSDDYIFHLVHATFADSYFSYTYPWTISENVELRFPEKHEVINQDKNNIIFYGHSHIPSVKYKVNRGEAWQNHLFENYGYKNNISNNFITIINPGSVGQPRDGDSRSSYAILELEEKIANITFYRVEYPIKTFIINSRMNWYAQKKEEDIDINNLQKEILNQTRNALGKRPIDDVNLTETEIKKFNDLLEIRKNKKGE